MYLSKEKKSSIAVKAGWVSIITNLLLFVIKLWVGIISRSVALIADAWHTLSDSVSSIILLIGIHYSKKPADKEHPFGHGRAELIASMIIGVILFIVAANFLFESANKLVNREDVDFGVAAIVVTILSIVAKEGMAQYSMFAFRRTNMRSLKADAWHHRSDAISSVIILAGIFLSPYAWWIDGVLGLLVALLIGWAAFGIIREGIAPLLGERPDEETVKKINSLAKEVSSKDLKLHHFQIHTYGDHVELSCHIILPSNMKLEEAHNIADRLQDRIKEQMDINATIHMEPDDPVLIPGPDDLIP